MLDEHGVAYTTREYTKQPLSADEISTTLAELGLRPKDVLRKRDKAFAELGLTGDEADTVLIGHMANHPGLLQRPIGRRDGKAVVGRPIENLLELAG